MAKGGRARNKKNISMLPMCTQPAMYPRVGCIISQCSHGLLQSVKFWPLSTVARYIQYTASGIGKWSLIRMIHSHLYRLCSSGLYHTRCAWYRVFPENLLWPTLVPAHAEATINIIRDEASGQPVDCYIWVSKNWELLWQNGSFGKGIMSRSDPTWLGRYQRAMCDQAGNGQRFIEDITAKRREARRDPVNGKAPDVLHLETMRDLNIATTDAPSMEPMQLSPFEALFLNTLECLEVRDSDHHIYSHTELWQLLAVSSKQADEFALKYAAYFYYRTRGWTVKSGIKFGADFLLYSKGGPSNSHAQYSVIVRRQDTRGTVDESWQYMFALSRVCSQVRKALIVCYVDRPTAKNAGGIHENEEATVPDLTEFQISEFLIERFNPNRK